MSSRDGLALDQSRWPLVVVHLPTQPVGDDEVERFVKDQRAMLARGERYIEVADTTGCHMFPASQRKMMGEFLREANPIANRLCAGLAIVIASSVMRGGTTAVFWIYRPSYPVKAVETMADAADFLRETAVRANLTLPTSAQAFLLRTEPRKTA